VQRSDQLVHFRESCGDESGFFLARIGPVGDPDVQPESSKMQLFVDFLAARLKELAL
jgi:hypothetical protein